MNRLVCVLMVVVGMAACGDNLRAGEGADGGVDGSTDAPIDGTSSVCGDGMITGTEQCESGACCTNCMFTAFDTQCRAAVGECDAAEVCSGLAAACPADESKGDGTTCTNGFCANGTCVTCNSAIDADFDGSNQCLDCDDTNGLVEPQASENACEGLDDDCDGMIDEDYDQDADMYSTCSTDPLLFDCNDTQSTTNPGAPELCGTAGTGNGRDDNCNGYIDELCTPCDPVDNDGDGESECMGDCDDTRAGVGVGQMEACDGFDTDCNAFTRENCDVSDPCNFAGSSPPDVCKEDLQCGCIVNAQGACTGDYRCASFCEGSYTGAIGAGCTATQTCAFRWTLSANQHACSETTEVLGTKLGGEICAADTECRSGDCDNICTGPGCQDMRCVDFCDHHAPGAAGSCAAGTTCEIVQGTVLDQFMYATCGLDNNGTRTTGQTCVGGCIWGPSSCVSGLCAQPCGEEAHCPTGTHCSLRGNAVTAGTWGVGTPTGVNGQLAIETVPVCLADSGTGAHDRRGGAACTANADCISQFCDATLNVCVDPCISDASCAVGLTCEPLYIKPTLTSGIVWSRACVNESFGEFLHSM